MTHITAVFQVQGFVMGQELRGFALITVCAHIHHVNSHVSSPLSGHFECHATRVHLHRPSYPISDCDVAQLICLLCAQIVKRWSWRVQLMMIISIAVI